MLTALSHLLWPSRKWIALRYAPLEGSFLRARLHHLSRLRNLLS
jgi:hypothetical protein